jgi:hypothetical protein
MRINEKDWYRARGRCASIKMNLDDVQPDGAGFITIHVLGTFR